MSRIFSEKNSTSGSSSSSTSDSEDDLIQPEHVSNIIEISERRGGGRGGDESDPQAGSTPPPTLLSSSWSAGFVSNLDYVYEEGDESTDDEAEDVKSPSRSRRLLKQQQQQQQQTDQHPVPVAFPAGSRAAAAGGGGGARNDDDDDVTATSPFQDGLTLVHDEALGLSHVLVSSDEEEDTLFDVDPVEDVSRQLYASVVHSDLHPDRDTWSEPPMGLEYQLALEADETDSSDESGPLVSGGSAAPSNDNNAAGGSETDTTTTDDASSQLILRHSILERYRPKGRELVQHIRPAVALARRRRKLELLQATKRQSWLRPDACLFPWLVFVIVCLMNLGNFVSYDVVSSLNEELKTNLHLTDVQIGSFYSIYNAPNILVPFLGGFLLDRWGLWQSAMLFSSIVSSGLVIFTIGSFLPIDVRNVNIAYYVMLFGRFVFAMGAESLFVSGDAILSTHFSPAQLRVALPIASVFNNIGDTLSFLFLPLLATLLGGFRYALMVPAGISLLGLLCSYLFAVIETKSSVYEEEQARKEEIEDWRLKLPSSTAGASLWSEIKDAYYETRELDATYWLLVFTVVCTTCNVFVWTGFFTNVLELKWQMDQVEASRVTGFSGLSTVVSVILIGIFTARLSIKQRSIIVCVAMGLILGSMIYLYVAPRHISPLPGVVLIGIAYAVVPSILWSSISEIINNDETIGSGYGVMYAFQNLVSTIGYTGVGAISHHYSSTLPFLIFWIPLAVLGAMFGMAWCIVLHVRDIEATQTIEEIDPEKRPLLMKSTIN